MEGLKEQALRRERQGGRLRRGADYTGRMSFEARKNVPGREWGSVRPSPGGFIKCVHSFRAEEWGREIRIIAEIGGSTSHSSEKN